MRTLLTFGFVAFAFAALAQTFPTLTGRVVDAAQMIDDGAEAALTKRLRAWEEASGNQVVVATLPDLAGRDIETYSVDLAREWELGRAEQNDGVLLLVARDDRKVRIEVGYGLEGTLTDALSSRIISDTILPAFRAGRFSSGIVDGADQILEVLGGGDLPKPTPTATFGGEEGENFVFSAFILMWLLFFLLPMLRRRGRKGRRRRGLPGVVVLPGGFGGGGLGGGGFGGGFGGGGGSFGGGGASGGW